MAFSVLKPNGIDLSQNFAFTGTVTGASSLVKISNTTISSDVGQVDIEPSNFTDYKVYILIGNRLQSSADSVDIGLRIKDSAYLSSEYSRMFNNSSSGGTSSILLNDNGLGNNTSGSVIYEDFSFQVTMFGFEANRRWRCFGQSSYGNTSSVKRGADFSGGNNDSDEITGLRVFLSAGDLKSGQLTLYGLETA
jgi:hypothetical protein